MRQRLSRSCAAARAPQEHDGPAGRGTKTDEADQYGGVENRDPGRGTITSLDTPGWHVADLAVSVRTVARFSRCIGIIGDPSVR